MAMPTVLVLQHDESEPLGTIAAALESQGITPRLVRGFDGAPVPEDLGDADGLIIMGGPMGVYEQERFPFLTHELRLIRRVWEAGRPILGVCLGSQLLAAALDAPVEPSPNPEIGWHPVTLTAAASDDPLWHDMPRVWTGFHWHGDVHGLPSGAERLAYSDRTPNQAFRAGPHAYGFQLHMEVTPEIVQDWLGSLRSAPEGGVQSAADILSGLQTHLPAMQSLAVPIFARWASLVSPAR